MDSIVPNLGADVQPQFRAKLHPCGTVTVGMIPNRAHTTADERRINMAVNKAERLEKLINEHPDMGIARLIRAGSISISEGVAALPPLGLSSLPNSRIGSQQEFQPSARLYGQNGITSFGKLRVKDGATVIQKTYGRNSLAFVTVTVPTLPAPIMEVICKNWGKFVNRLVEEIKRELRRKNSPQEIIYCTEIQEKRFHKYGVVAPHLHLLWYAYSGTPGESPKTGKKEYAISAQFLRELVGRIIHRITGKTDIFTAASIDIQKVKKDAAAYLGKYMSKGGKIVEEIKKAGKQELLPRQWWGITKELRIKVERAIKVVDGSPAANIFYHHKVLVDLGLVKYHRWVFSEQVHKQHQQKQYQVNPNTGEISWNSFYYELPEPHNICVSKCYGAVMQLSKSAMRLIPLLVKVMDICNDMSAIDIEDVRHWISHIKNDEMMQEFCIVLDNMKLIYWDRNYQAQISGLHKPTTAYAAN
jgi:hypothetical protein